MAEVRRIGSLDIAEDDQFQRRQWVAERIAWIIILMLIVLGLLGLFGNGILSQQAATAGPLTLEYQQVVRQRAPAKLRIEIAAPAAAEIQLWVERDFLDASEITRIEPEPEDTLAGAGRVVYQVLLEQAAEAAVITIAYEPRRMGLSPLRLGIVDGPELTVSRLVMP